VGVHSDTGVMSGAIAADVDTIDLRILATTDLHAHLTARDYTRRRSQSGFGLTRVATLVHQARAAAVNSILVDNGDAIQGSALSDFEATGARGPVAMIAAMNALGYDAGTVGNHEFSLGLGYLDRALAEATFPIVSANLRRVGAGPDLAPWVILDRLVQDRAGQSHALRIGVFGVAPPQVLIWDGTHVAGRLTATGMIGAAVAAVTALRAAGADVVVGLCHTGLSADATDTENTAAEIARHAGADALVAGHAHQVFPGPAFAALPGADLAQGRLWGCPVVMPGHHGSHLGVIDLRLCRGSRGWRVEGGTGQVMSVSRRNQRGREVALAVEDRALRKLATGPERRLRRWLASAAGTTEVPLTSYYALAADTVLSRRIGQAMRAHAREMIAATGWRDVPVLAAVAPFRAGGRGGPANYVDVPAGGLTRRDVAAIDTHPNRFSVVVVTGRVVRQWIERAVSLYMPPRGDGTGPLVDPEYPTFAADVLHGLTYRVDLTRAPAIDARGRPVVGGGGRVLDLCHAGCPLGDDDRFAVATNGYRASVLHSQGSAGIHDRIDDLRMTRDVLHHHLQAGATLLDPPQWGFAALGGQQVIYTTGPAAAAQLDDVAHMAPRVLGTGADGFLRVALTL
jgi:2',3'-cyclic-nucleotide 2'-phosphodiesterase / 3'-nucleotidase